MEFVFLGFDQSASARQFRFGRIRASRPHTAAVVVADLSLARKYNIQVQDLPLLCRNLLENSDAGTVAAGVITLTETHMAALSKAARNASEAVKP